MGKKRKQRGKNNPNEEAEEEEQATDSDPQNPPVQESDSCIHIKQITNSHCKNFINIREKEDLCQDCSKDKRNRSNRKAMKNKSAIPVHLCLHCGSCLCKEHIELHYERKKHHISIELKSLDCWCLECNRTLSPEQYHVLKQCIGMLQGKPIPKSEDKNPPEEDTYITPGPQPQYPPPIQASRKQKK
jgi:hypothetical protein